LGNVQRSGVRVARSLWRATPFALAASVRSLLLVGTGAALGACGPPLERTPQVVGRSDAVIARADTPVWKPGDSWYYRGRTFDSKDNRFYIRVIGDSRDAGPPAYEVDSPEYVETIDKGTLRPIRQRNKESGQVTGAMTFNPLWFPLDFASRFSSHGFRFPEGEDDARPYMLTCRVVNYEDVEVHAGKFAAFRIDCETNGGFAEHWYAPRVKNLVKIRWMGKRESFTAELWGYEIAK
jgi:hypothetical protein